MSFSTRNLVVSQSPVLILAIALLITPGCTDTVNPVSVVPAYPATSSTVPAGTPPAALHTIPVVSAPPTPACTSPPLNLWTGIPESYTPTGTTDQSLKTGTLVSKADLFGTPSLRWKSYYLTMQYRMNPGGILAKSRQTGRMEISREVSEGKTVNRVTETTTFSQSEPLESPEQVTVTDTLHDEKSTMLSQHRKTTVNGQSREEDIAVKKPVADCSGALFTPVYEYAGREPVTVPAGSYPVAMKYVRKEGTATITYWFAPGVPVEVKKVIVNPEKEETDVLELTGWG